MKEEKTRTKKQFKMPKWTDCSWRRVACDKDNCPFCGRIKKYRQRHIERGEEPDDMKCVLEDVGNTFKETLALIKKDAKRFGIDIENIAGILEPPEPEKFPLCNAVVKWRNSVYSLIENKELPLWAYTEAADDIFWYSNTICAKTYRQLCNRWHIEKKDGYGDFDYDYTQHVLGECFDIIQKAIEKLIPVSEKDAVKLMYISDGAQKLKERILRI